MTYLAKHPDTTVLLAKQDKRSDHSMAHKQSL